MSINQPNSWDGDQYDAEAQRLYEVGDYDQALDLLKHALNQYPDSTELLVSDGNSYPGGLQRDTLIMTELEFLSGGGFRVSRYKYLKLSRNKFSNLVNILLQFSII